MMKNPKIDLYIINVYPLFAELDIDSVRGGPRGPDIEKGPLEGVKGWENLATRHFWIDWSPINPKQQ